MSLLYNEPPIAVSPTLMSLLGVSEAIFLQQVHYWIENKKSNASKYQGSFVEGHWWVYNSLAEWQEQLSYLGSESTIKRIISDLKSKGVLVVEKHNALGFDKTNWYRINYDRLNQLIDQVKMTRRSGQNDPTIRSNLPNAQGQNDPIQEVKSNRPIPKTSQRLQTKTSYKDISPSSAMTATLDDQIDYFNLDSEQQSKVKESNQNTLSQSKVSEADKQDWPPAACGKVEKRKAPKVGQHDPEGFDTFWEQYPKKTARADALKAWNKLKPNAELVGTILHDISQRKAVDSQWSEIRFVPNPATYLNGQRWTDAVIKPGSPPPVPRHAQQTISEDEQMEYLRSYL